MPQTETHWEGGGESVQIRPDAPRDHSAWAAERMAEIEKKIQGDQTE
jgi:hypothetical protein